MSYFLTISGGISERDVSVPARLVPASRAHTYVADIKTELERLDAAPAYLIEDAGTGMSDELVMEVNQALWEERPVSELPVVVLPGTLLQE